MRPLLLAALLFSSTHAQTQAGYTPAASFFSSDLVGTWTNQFLHLHDGQVPQVLWQRVEIGADGLMAHDYFTADPAQGAPDPIERLFSRWSAGLYVDPDPAQGSYLVIRIAPYEAHSLIAGTRSYRTLVNYFVPVYRRFSLSKLEDELALSEPFVLVIPFVEQLRSFPSDATFLSYTRHEPNALPSPVLPTSWGHIKQLKR